MNELTPRQPRRPLLWPDAVLDFTDVLVDSPLPVYAVGGGCVTLTSGCRSTTSI